MIRRTMVPFALAFACLLFAGCRTNLLPEYMPKVESANVVVFMADTPQVSMGSSGNTGAFGLVAGLGWASEMQDRLAKVLDPKALATGLAASFEQQLQPSFGTAIVANVDQPHDSTIHIEVQEFGVYAASVEDPAYYHMRADVRMVYVPENKLIWEYTAAIREPLKPVHLSGDGLAAFVGTAMNFTALNDLDDETLREVFAALAADAGADIVAQMRDDAAD